MEEMEVQEYSLYDINTNKMEFAKIENGIVVNVEVASQEHIDTLEETYIASPSNGTTAGKGFTYDEKNNVFIAPKPFESWVLNDKFQWQAPKVMPTDDSRYYWNEETTNWDKI